MRLTVHVREFKHTDLDECMGLFRDTVHTINAKDYKPSQLHAWAPEQANKKEWLKSLSENITYLAEYKGTIVGFGCITSAGYFDKLYVHKDFQFKGIAVAITKKIIAHAKNSGIKKITAEVSITAKPFCEHFGMRVSKEQTKHFRGETFINYLMEGDLTK